MSKTLHYSEDCTLLESRRQKLVELIKKAVATAWLIDQQIKVVHGYALAPSSYPKLDEQRDKLDWLLAAMEDFLEYMNEARAWAPEEKAEAGAAMDGLLGAIGPANERKSK